MADAPQSFENHAKFVPVYHYGVLPILAVNLVWSVWRLVQAPDVDRAMAALVALAIVLGVVFGRVFALKVQDRVIRLEMRLRLQSLLPQEQRARINELTPAQLVALRFASDGELPSLVATVQKDNIQDRKTIKKMIKRWQADHVRA